MKGLEGLINGGLIFGGAGGGGEEGGAISYIAVLIKILFEFDRFSERQNVVKSQILFNTC